jgi:glycosyltransferase involved in cell wall biosynthesis
MRLLVVSFAFPPFNSIGGVRVGKIVKYMLTFGHDVRVITARDQPFARTLPLEIPSEKITYSKWLTVRRKPVYSSSTPAELSTPTGDSSSSKNALKPVLKRAIGYPLKTLVDFPDSNIGWLPYAESAAARLFNTWQPDLIFASSPPPTSLLVAHRLSRKYSVPWVADLRDLWIDHPYYNQPGWRRLVEEKLERRIILSTAGVTTVSEPLAETLQRKYGKSACVVLNGFDQVDYPVRSEVPFDNGRLKILYTGMIYPGKRDPSPLFEALQRLGPLAEQIRVVFHGFFLDSVRPMIRRYGLEHLVEINDPVSYKESLRMQTEADILLLLLWSDPTERGVYTGKLFEYMGARRPILAVGGIDTVAADLIRKRRLGVALAKPADIALQLEAWLEQKEMQRSIPALRDDAITGVSRQEQTRVLESHLLQILHSKNALPDPFTDPSHRNVS